MIGKILSKRYKILDEIGGGGMAVVYKGQDILLNRVVTIKILRDQYTNDANFIKRFRREAQAVASLSHPNIVSIYDVGEDGGVHYLVMEYVEGQNLKEIIKKEAPLDFERSIEIAIQICDALEHAHSNGVIHRDIKPHNILITPNGRVKVTDFGIARAATETTITYTGSMVGSVHYISPEQARGKITNYKSDIYSAGVVLYEMVTGKVPFSGDSPITVAIKHIQEEIPRIRDINPNVPDALAKVINTALSKAPEERYESAKEMKRDLINVLYKLRNIAEEQEEDTDSFDSNKKRKLRPIGWVLLIILLIGGLYAAYAGIMEYLIVEEVKVPDVTGIHIQEAQEILQKKELKFEITNRRHNELVPKDHVLEQDPPPQEVIKKNRIVKLEVSLGPELLKVPNVKGETLRSARIIIINSRFSLSPDIKEVYDPDVPEGIIINQNPEPGDLKPEGSEVKLIVSKGPEPKYIKMPELIGLSLARAEEKLREVRLNLGVVSYQESKEYFTGQVIQQDIQPGEEILQDSTVNLVVSKGPGPKPKSATVRMRVDDDGKEHIIKIVVEDQKGIHQEYYKKHEPGDYIRTTVPFYGKGIIKVYQDGKLIHEKSVS